MIDGAYTLELWFTSLRRTFSGEDEEADGAVPLHGLEGLVTLLNTINSISTI